MTDVIKKMSTEKYLRVCDVLYFATILKDCAISAVTISEKDFLTEAKKWRRAVDNKFVADKCDDYTTELVAKVNSIPHIEADLSFDETIALLFLLYEQRQALGTVWKDFCDAMKSGVISFALGVQFLVKWANHVMPTEPPTLHPQCKNGALDRLLADLVPHKAMYAFYAGRIGVAHDYDWPSIYKFNHALRNMFSWKQCEIGTAGVLTAGTVYYYPNGWTPELTEVLKTIAKK